MEKKQYCLKWRYPSNYFDKKLPKTFFEKKKILKNKMAKNELV